MKTETCKLLLGVGLSCLLVACGNKVQRSPSLTKAAPPPTPARVHSENLEEEANAVERETFLDQVGRKTGEVFGRKPVIKKEREVYQPAAVTIVVPKRGEKLSVESPGEAPATQPVEK